MTPEETILIDETKRTIAVKADSRDVLIAYLKGFQATKDGVKITLNPLLEFSMVCGGRAFYKTLADIPYEDVPCPCGDPTHWMIKYGVD